MADRQIGNFPENAIPSPAEFILGVGGGAGTLGFKTKLSDLATRIMTLAGTLGIIPTVPAQSPPKGPVADNSAHDAALLAIDAEIAKIRATIGGIGSLVGSAHMGNFLPTGVILQNGKTIADMMSRLGERFEAQVRRFPNNAVRDGVTGGSGNPIGPGLILVFDPLGTATNKWELWDIVTEGGFGDFATATKNLLLSKTMLDTFAANCLIQTGVKIANYAALNGEEVPVDIGNAAGTVTISLPNAPAPDYHVAVYVYNGTPTLIKKIIVDPLAEKIRGQIGTQDFIDGTVYRIELRYKDATHGWSAVIYS